MADHQYHYPIEQCDVPLVRRKTLQEYRNFRVKCLEYIRSDADTSVTSQIHRLAWHTAVFKTLNEARRIESEHAINGPMWELIGAGYTTLVTLGVRRLVDRDPRADSVWNVLDHLRKRPELLRREHYVCFDGVPYDGTAAFSRYMASLSCSVAGVDNEDVGEIISRDNDWGMSQILHKAFDRLAGFPEKRKRLDEIPTAIIQSAISQIESPVIERVCDLANRRFAHAERINPDNPISPATFNDVDAALRIIVRVTNFLSASIFQDAAFGRVVPVPQYNVLANLDNPWISTARIPELRHQWDSVCKTMDDWADNINDEFLPIVEKGV